MNTQLQTPLSFIESKETNEYTYITTHYDEKYEAVWCYMHAEPRPCFTPALLDDLNGWCAELSRQNLSSEDKTIRYHILASRVPGVYNVGGDLELFRELVQLRDREGLSKYAKGCIDALYSNIDHFGHDITTISLVQGDALGGGFETALSSEVLIAERSARMGLPEVLFNLFPGMGAYSLLSRKLDPKRAEKLILSGKIYSAEELHELGLVDVLVEDGEGEMAVYDYIRRENKSRNGVRAFRAAKNCVNPITYQELLDVTKIWVDAALRLQPRDLRMMERLVARQSQKITQAA